MLITKEEAIASLIRFIQENNKYPTKNDMRNTGYLYSQMTYLRLVGPRSGLTLLEEYGTPVEAITRHCKCCGKTLEETRAKKQNVFCSRSCAATYNNPLKPPRVKTTKKTVTVAVSSTEKVVYKLKDVRNCVECGTILERATQKVYCKPQCKADHTFKLRLAHWLETGEKTENRILRKYITHLDGYKCSCCGISEWQGKPITLEVEHKDGNSEDDRRENVCLICPNCHSQTDTYKGKNRGNGRHARAQRYRDGKSY